MNPAQYELLSALFLEARQMRPDRRGEFLSQVAQREPGLITELNRMLTCDARPSAPLDALASGGGARALAGSLSQSDWTGADPSRLPALETPRQIGRYSIIRLIGEGGMGIVYEAQQDDPRRRVALKILRAGFGSERLVERFHREAQMLGRLHHRGIAQIYEAQTSPPVGEAPYFVMELIDGPPLSCFASDRKLTIRQRLELIAEIGDALAYAHAQGVVHRDLKPGNILVDTRSQPAGRTDDDPLASLETRLGGQPKILDFGVARCAEWQTLTEAESGRLVGTIPYMSPEQAGGGAIDARSDVYSLGVIAFELLAGRLPYDVAGKMPHEAARIIRDDEPLRLGVLDRRLRGDIEVIVAKALEKDAAGRYASAADLAADIRRHLLGRTIMARPASLPYRAWRIAGRRKALTAAAMVALAGAAMLTASVLTLSQRGLSPEGPPIAADAEIRSPTGMVTDVRYADAWLADHPTAEAYAFDRFFPSIDSADACLAGACVPVVLQLAGGTLTLSAFDAGGAPTCAIRDGSSFANLSDAYIEPGGVLVLEFNPPIRAFYGMFGSLEKGASVTERLYFRGALVGVSAGAKSRHSGNAQGHGFAALVPIDRIEITTNDSGDDGRGAMLGAFRFLRSGEPSLGTIRIPGYGSAYGDVVHLDFACVFEGL
ncbi:Serine/threonine-protein kinase PknA [Phycisphaerae bacterium RAS1]|nr:Serine/threonine-protein kinase PknA [Phycisphaerae bacterium RAS1]